MEKGCRSGKMAWVDLSTGRVQEKRLEDWVYKTFIGGKGLGAYLLYRHVMAGTEPFSASNTLFFLTGPLQAVGGPSIGRWSIVTKSPLTGLFLDSHCGGPLGREIKRAGYDVLAVRGKAAEPVVLHVTDDSIDIEPAEDVWGAGIYRATETLHERYGREAAVYTIGPAGERGILFATGACEIAHQTGRGGVGAVMGWKNLKAVVAQGTHVYLAADPDDIREVNREVAKTWRENKTGFPEIGTAFLVEVANGLGQFPTRNWEAGYFERHEELDMRSLHKTRWAGQFYSCPHCIMRCTHAYKTPDPDDPTRDVDSTVEYETLGLMGGNLGISDPIDVLQLNYLSDNYGLDTISTGSVIGFAIECYKRGIITSSELGIEPEFGDVASAIHILKSIVNRVGIGDTLALGVRRAAKRLGRGAEEYAVHVKGLEVAAWDPRGRRGMGLSYATADVGGSHLRGWPATTDPPDASALDLVESMVRARDEKVLTDSLVVCHFTYHLPLRLEQKIRLLNAATGENYTEEDIFLFAKRVAAVTRMFNVREGICREYDDLPPRLWQPQSQGPRAGLSSFVSRQDFEDCLDRFYELRGWDATGCPTRETLRELGLLELGIEPID